MKKLDMGALFRALAVVAGIGLMGMAIAGLLLPGLQHQIPRQLLFAGIALGMFNIWLGTCSERGK